MSNSRSHASLPVLDLPSADATTSALKYPSSVPSWARPTNSVRSSRTASPDVSQASSPVSSSPGADSLDESAVLALSAGCQPDSLYTSLLPKWRNTIRRKLVKSVEWESPRLGSAQKAVRTPSLDTYFIWSSIFGTHSAFMIGLPIFWWFGYPLQGRR